MCLRSSAVPGTGVGRPVQRRRAEAGHSPAVVQQRRSGTAGWPRLEGKAGGPVNLQGSARSRAARANMGKGASQTASYRHVPRTRARGRRITVRLTRFRLPWAASARLPVAAARAAAQKRNGAARNGAEGVGRRDRKHG